VDPVVAVGLELGLHLRYFAPAVEVVVGPDGLTGLRVGLDVHDLGHLAAKHREGAAHVDDADGLVELVEDQDVSAEYRGETAAMGGVAPGTERGGMCRVEVHLHRPPAR
jgi:hypothetical protein